MAQLTLQAMILQVQRRTAGMGITAGEIHRELDHANKDIQQSMNWPWNYSETNVLVPANYTTGTISITDQTATVTGTGTSWDPAWIGYRLRFGSNNIDYIVQSVDSATQITLAQPINTGANWTNVGYTLYKDTFQMPSDFMPGKDLIIGNATLRMRIKHIPRYQFEEQMLVLRPLFTNVTMYYTDHEYNATAKKYQIRFCPPISSVGEYRLVYHKNPPDLTALTQTSSIPDGFDECIELTAIARLKTAYGSKDAAAANALAGAKLRMLQKQIKTAIKDNQPKDNLGISDSSFSQGGLMISPWST